MNVIINSIAVGKWKMNCYIAAIANEAWIIDPGDDTERIIETLKLDNYTLKGIINTHGHFDHIGEIANIKEKYKIPFFIHSKDKRLVSQGNLYRRMAGDLTVKKTPVIDGFLDSKEHIKLVDKQIKVHHTPGHTNGSVCFEIEQNLIVGDLFFEKNVGRTDLPGGDKELLINSLNFVFDKFIGFQIYPGHGESFILTESTVEKLKAAI
jgi:glyoxylase-like metal-dependent hydrolase (beta-lactamase superfamily II)